MCMLDPKHPIDFQSTTLSYSIATLEKVLFILIVAGVTCPTVITAVILLSTIKLPLHLSQGL